MAVQLLTGDALDVLATVPAHSVQACITSPPFFGLRDYGTGTWEGGSDPACDHKRVPSHVGPASTLRSDGSAHTGPYDGERATIVSYPYREQCGKCGAVLVDRQIGVEATPAAYVARLVAVFDAVKRVLRPDGLLFVELGDSSANDAKWGGTTGGKHAEGLHGVPAPQARQQTEIAPKSLIGIPWRVAFALQDAGWILRAEIIWSRPNPMPESVRDRVTRSHSTIFMFSQQERYFYDREAIAEPAVTAGSTYNIGEHTLGQRQDKSRGRRSTGHTVGEALQVEVTRNKRSVWTVATQPYTSGRPDLDHFAAWPEGLVEPMILCSTSAKGACPQCGAPWRRVVEKVRLRPAAPSGNREIRRWDTAPEGHLGGRPATHERGWQPTCGCGAALEPAPSVVLDCFAGTGTTLRVATRHGRDAIGIDLNPQYGVLQEDRLDGVQQSFESLVR